MFNFAILLGDLDMFKAMDVMFFDEGNNLISTQVDPLFGFGMSDKD